MTIAKHLLNGNQEYFFTGILLAKRQNFSNAEMHNLLKEVAGKRIPAYTKEEKQQLRELAQSKGLSLSDYFKEI